MAWRERAACKGMVIDVFFPSRGDWRASDRAKQICAGCPVADACLLDTLHVDPMFDGAGIFAGTTAKERVVLRRRLGITPTFDHGIHFLAV